MAPVLVNLYTCLVMECWQTKIEDVGGLGVNLRYNMTTSSSGGTPGMLLRGNFTGCFFADDGALLASTRSDVERAVREYQIVCTEIGLTVSIPKTMQLVTGREIVGSDQSPIKVSGGEINCVDEFQYLGSRIAASGRMDGDVEMRIAQASRTLGALHKVVFMDKNLTLYTKRMIYNACVLSVLLYGSECWIPLRKHIKKLNTFHHRCIRTIVGITNRQQWAEHITMAEVRWRDEETAAVKVIKHRLEWLGHLACMLDHRIPKSALFGWLPQVHPRCGPRRRWKDVIRRGLKDIEMDESKWYEDATTSRAGWKAAYRLGLENSDNRIVTEHLLVVACEVVCEVCSRKFRRESDKKRHKYTSEREKPVCE